MVDKSAKARHRDARDPGGAFYEACRGGMINAGAQYVTWCSAS
jgi:hypothetical protein